MIDKLVTSEKYKVHEITCQINLEKGSQLFRDEVYNSIGRSILDIFNFSRSVVKR